MTALTEYFELGGSGQATIGAAESALPDQAARAVRIKAGAGNSGDVYVGRSGVLTTDGFHLDAGEDTGWIPVNNLSDVALIASGAGQDVSYIYLT